MSSATTENTLRLARRVLDYEAYSLVEHFSAALTEHNQLNARLYSRAHNNLVALREKLTEEGILNIVGWDGPEAIEKIYFEG